jgi:phosphatidate cytidylyltransferase
MLRTRVITAVVLLAILLPVLYFNNYTAFAVVATVFFGAAIWECFRLFNPDTHNAHVIAIVWAAVFAISVFTGHTNLSFWAALSVALWIARFAPSLKIGLPPLGTPANTLLSLVYAFAVVGCFAAIVDLYSHSPLFLLSVLAIVWVADIGAYFSGKASASTSWLRRFRQVSRGKARSAAALPCSCWAGSRSSSAATPSRTRSRRASSTTTAGRRSSSCSC